MVQPLQLTLILLGVLFIGFFVYIVYTRHQQTHEGFVVGRCGTNSDAVFDSSAKVQTGPLANCAIGSSAFYAALAAIKGSKSSAPSVYKFTLPGGVDPLKNQVPGTLAYTTALKRVGTAVLDPTNWSIAGTYAMLPSTVPDANTGGSLPQPAGTGSTPNTMPGSTVANSKEGLANLKDLIAFRDTLKTFNSLYEKNIVKAAANTELQYLHANAISYNVKIQAQIDTGNIVDSQVFISGERAKYEKVIIGLRQGVLPVSAVATKKAVPAAKMEISLADLEDAIVRAKAEKKRIDSLRSSSTDLKKRASTLDMVSIDLQDLVGKIRRGELKISQLPFNKNQLNKFLAEVKTSNSKVTPLPMLKKAQKAAAAKKASAAKKAAGGFPLQPPTSAAYIGALSQFRRAVQDLSWDVHVGYDPNTTLHRTTLDRMTHITNQIESGKVKGEAQKALLVELDGLRNQASAHRHHAMSQKHSLTPYEPFDQQTAHALGDGPAINRQVPVKQEILQNLPQTSSSDWRIRPGYEPTTESIANRASLASFDYSKVGTADYKSRAIFLCSQIRDSGLGDPKEFGCVGNPETDVSPEYSWRGNYKMVCNRLSNTWGGWYPEMFGCPKEDIAQMQTPVIHLTK